MARFAAVVLLLLLTAVPASAQQVSSSDKAAIAGVIQDQIAAFRVDDAQRAFGYASPAIQAKFGTPEAFLEMVRTGYVQVYRAGEVTFRDLTVEEGVPVQAVEIRGIDGTGVLALYFMERQPDGSWKINGVLIAELPERVA
jgi:ketosteroid isomerase-like protein